MRLMARLVRRPLAWSLLALGAAVFHAACGGGGGAGGLSGPANAPSGTTSATPSDEAGAPGPVASGAASTSEAQENPWDEEFDRGACHGSEVAQCTQHAADVVDALGDLIDVEECRDKRAVPIGIDAIGGSDAELVVEGLRIVGRFPKEPGVYAAVLPRLVDPRPVVQNLAARVLRGTTEGADLGRQYDKGHGHASLEGVPSDLHQPPRPPASFGFAALANATPYPPGDGPFSIGFETTASVEEVAAFYAQQPNAKRMSAADYGSLRRKALDDVGHGGEVEEIQRIQERALRAHAMPSAADQKKMNELMEKLKHGAAAAEDATPYPPDAVLRDGQFVVLSIDGNVPQRWVAVYREPAYDRTIAILAWAPALMLPPVPPLDAFRTHRPHR